MVGFGMNMSFGMGFNPMMGMGMMNPMMGMMGMSAGFMAGMGMFRNMSSMCCGRGSMMPFGGMPRMRGGMRQDPVGGIFGQVARNKAATDKKCKTSMLGNFLGKTLGLIGGAALAVGALALVVGTGGLAAAPLLVAGVGMGGAMLGSHVGGSVGFLAGGGASLMRGQAHTFGRFM